MFFVVTNLSLFVANVCAMSLIVFYVWKPRSCCADRYEEGGLNVSSRGFGGKDCDNFTADDCKNGSLLLVPEEKISGNTRFAFGATLILVGVKSVAILLVNGLRISKFLSTALDAARHESRRLLNDGRGEKTTSASTGSRVRTISSAFHFVIISVTLICTFFLVFRLPLLYAPKDLRWKYVSMFLACSYAATFVWYAALLCKNSACFRNVCIACIGTLAGKTLSLVVGILVVIGIIICVYKFLFNSGKLKYFFFPR